VVEQEAERINTKAKRVAGKLRKKLDPGFVAPLFLLTRGEIKFETEKRPQIRGVSVFGLPECLQLIAFGGEVSLLQNSSFVGDLFAPAGELKEVRTAISGMMRFSSQTS
jgi:hypothetical protein